jgi:hypothetical protein
VEYNPPTPDCSPPPPYNTLEDMAKDYLGATGEDCETTKRKVRFSTTPSLFRCSSLTRPWRVVVSDAWSQMHSTGHR